MDDVCHYIDCIFNPTRELLRISIERGFVRCFNFLRTKFNVNRRHFKLAIQHRRSELLPYFDMKPRLADLKSGLFDLDIYRPKIVRLEGVPDYIIDRLMVDEVYEFEAYIKVNNIVFNDGDEIFIPELHDSSSQGTYHLFWHNDQVTPAILLPFGDNTYKAIIPFLAFEIFEPWWSESDNIAIELDPNFILKVLRPKKVANHYIFDATSHTEEGTAIFELIYKGFTIRIRNLQQINLNMWFTQRDKVLENLPRPKNS